MHLMITDGGPHPPDKWADFTTWQIMTAIDIAPSADPSFAKAKRDFEYKLFGLLTDLHDGVQASERGKLKQDAAHIGSVLSPQQAASDAANKVVESARGTPFADHFQKNEVRGFIYQTLCQHFGDAMHIERSWHADRNPGCSHVQSYRAKQRG